MSSETDHVTTVLIVDDNPQLLEFVSDTLQELGTYRVVTAADGVEGLQRYYEVRPDCVIIDVKMPRLNGLQLVKALRGDPETAQTPLILLSALVQDNDRLAGLLSGADQYLVKPVPPLDLIAAIERAIALGDDERQRRLQQLAEVSPMQF
jgi:CheY-like chemotaxis protein